jgi:NAD(P)-dependent dehydrogenase (short-subunit alcohol dehydrogenase family)
MSRELVVLITGAAGLIGSTLSQNLVAKGIKVVLVDVNEVKLSKVTANFSESCFLAIVANSEIQSEIEHCIHESVKKFGRIDAAIHLAYPKSVGWGTKFEDISQANLYEDLSSQLGGAILFSQKILGFFKKQGYGNLIHISSIMGLVTPKFENYIGTKMTSPIEYTAIKAALIAITKYLAKYYRGNNIRINCISPGGILDQQPKIFIEKYRSCCNEKGMLEPEDLVGAALFLLSDQSQYINGQNVVVDDGWSL